MIDETVLENGIAALHRSGDIAGEARGRWPRRAVLKTMGAGIAGGTLTSFATGSAAAKGTSRSKSNARFGLGESGTLGDGQVVTFALPTMRGRPGVLGVLVTADALEGLPDEPQMVHLDLPRVSGTRFTFMGIDWNPMGHDPEPIYGLPHFDVHFYLVAEKAVEAIGPGVAEYTIPDEQLPPGYVTADALGAPREIVPEMGEHLVSPTAREFQGEGFTHTLVWGAYNPDGGDVGELTFIEPMITAAYLEGKPSDVHAPISTPGAFADAGYYPTEYAIRYLDGLDAYVITLEAFEWFSAVE